MLAISHTVRRSRTSDGGILLDVRKGRILCFNATASMILDRIEEGASEERIVECLSTEYGAGIDTVRADVREFLEELGRHGILRELPPKPGAEAANGNRDAA